MTLKKKREFNELMATEREAHGFGYNTSQMPKKFKYESNAPNTGRNDIFDSLATPKINLLKLPKMMNKKP